ncbi:uncharacterized protein LOC131624790 [Vicia villosa]|uniref:uncharacterized protein LOC131624790 n=1 Tax=Vicia villosa TaxID=3911 RepID=UPI00273C7CFE|nr:uncharacterized protein LOC131624790 [Vicia villosa]
MGRGRPKKKAVLTTPTRTRVISSPSGTKTSSSILKGKSPTPSLEIIVEEPKGKELGESEKIGPTIENAGTPQLWVDVIKGNRLPSSGREIEYTVPKVVNGEIEVQLEEQDLVSEMKFSEHALIMYALGDELSMNGVRKFMMNYWNFVTLPELYYNEEGFFLIRFKSKEDIDEVLMRGPYTIYKKPMLLHEWTPDFTLQDDILRVLPIWVTFPQLPLMMWGDKSIGKIASALGKPVMVDECTAKKLRVTYARVLIEVDVTNELKNYINIRDPSGKLLSQQVDYEWRPPF